MPINHLGNDRQEKDGTFLFLSSLKWLKPQINELVRALIVGGVCLHVEF